MHWLTGNYGAVVYDQKAYGDLSSEDKQKQKYVKPDHVFRSMLHDSGPISQGEENFKNHLLKIYKAGNHTCFHFKNRKNICFDQMSNADIGSIVNKKVNSKIIYSPTRVIRDALAQAVDATDPFISEKNRSDPAFQYNFTIEEEKHNIFSKALQVIDTNRSEACNSFESTAMAVETGCGNCGEMTNYGEIILRGFGYTGPVKQWNYGNHAFLCIGDKGCEREYIIDPHVNEHYSLSEIDSHLMYGTAPTIFNNSLTGYGKKNMSRECARKHYPNTFIYEKNSDEGFLAVKFDSSLPCVIL